MLRRRTLSKLNVFFFIIFAVLAFSPGHEKYFYETISDTREALIATTFFTLPSSSSMQLARGKETC